MKEQRFICQRLFLIILLDFSEQKFQQKHHDWKLLQLLIKKEINKVAYLKKKKNLRIASG